MPAELREQFAKDGVDMESERAKRALAHAEQYASEIAQALDSGTDPLTTEYRLRNGLDLETGEPLMAAVAGK